MAERSEATFQAIKQISGTRPSVARGSSAFPAFSVLNNPETGPPLIKEGGARGRPYILEYVLNPDAFSPRKRAARLMDRRASCCAPYCEHLSRAMPVCVYKEDAARSDGNNYILYGLGVILNNCHHYCIVWRIRVNTVDCIYYRDSRLLFSWVYGHFELLCLVNSFLLFTGNCCRLIMLRLLNFMTKISSKTKRCEFAIGERFVVGQ